jgi:uncharacterized membrane protein
MDRIKIDRKRHILKALTWRVIASLTTFLIVFIATGEIKAGISIGLIDFFAKLIFYYFHERIWYKSNFGINGKRSKSILKIFKKIKK